jgi:signal transduction histidine kinase
VIVDPEQLRRVISNIVGNSVKYMDKSDPSITMDLKDVGDFVQIELGDNGKGIAAKDLGHIFKRFVKIDTFSPGTGLGLAVARQIMDIVEGLGGQGKGGSRGLDICIESAVPRLASGVCIIP